MKRFRHLWLYLTEFFKNEEKGSKICRQNENTHFMFKNFFPEILFFMR